MQKGILYDYLNKKRKEVADMFNKEFDYDEFIRVRTEEAREDAIAEGRAEGRALEQEKATLQRIYDIIDDNIEDLFGDNIIINKLKKRFNLSHIDAAKYVAEYHSGELRRKIDDYDKR